MNSYVVICHCTDCKTISGAPYRVTVPVKAMNFKFLG
ncbi:GFA family protein [Bradyrhizobium sp. AZCC 1610]